MSIYLFWGEDDFSMTRSIESLRQSSLDPNWVAFNEDKISADQGDALTHALTQSMTPPFGGGSRFVWLVETTITQQCPPEILSQLESTLPLIPESTVFLLTTRHKPDGRLKSTKYLQEHAKIQEFSLIPPWKTDELEQQVSKIAQEVGVKLTRPAVVLLTEAVGNNTRLLYNELEKLKLYGGEHTSGLGEDVIRTLVQCSSQNSLQLASAIRQGQKERALDLIADLISQNEPALKIVATLVGQFRTWLWVKVLSEAKMGDDKIAQALELGNPKRIYFLKQEVKSLRIGALEKAFPVLLELEGGLKRGGDEMATLQAKILVLCELFC